MRDDGLTGSRAGSGALAGRHVVVREKGEEKEYGKPERESVFLSKERDEWEHRVSPRGAGRVLILLDTNQNERWRSSPVPVRKRKLARRVTREVPRGSRVN